ncbi:type II secretion system protein [bacterium]|nr:type II secretion system protein [bacterium]
MSKKSGYTLAETLISVLVIGIIAAICAPMIRNSIPNKNFSLLKKAYYVVDNVVKDLMNDTYYYPDMRSNCVDMSGTNNTNYLSKAQAEALGITNCFTGLDYNQQVNIAGTNQVAGGNWKFARLFISKLETQETLEDAFGRLAPDVSPKTITTTDGIVYNFDRMNYNEARGGYLIRIDVNGAEGPNSYAPSYTNSDGDNLNSCESFTRWEPTQAGSHYENSRFDRAALLIHFDGTIEITNTQSEFANILNSQNNILNGNNNSI